MELWKGIVLGMLQGLTEFLPISSSGHLVIFRYFLGIEEAGVTFGVFLHLATLIAVFIAFWEDILGLIKAAFRLFASIFKFRSNALKTLLHNDPYVRLLILLLIASLPAGVIGLAFNDLFEELFNAPLFAGVMLVMTGFILWFVSKLKEGDKSPEHISVWDAILIGAAQAIAILPGISRSGSTIAGGLLRGLNREDAARFSFLLSIPVILGASLFEARNMIYSVELSGGVALIGGFLSAIIFGYIAIKLLLAVIKKGRLELFAYYCWLAGVVTVLLIK